MTWWYDVLDIIESIRWVVLAWLAWRAIRNKKRDPSIMGRAFILAESVSRL